MSKERAWESRLNIALSDLLNKAGVGSRPEIISKEGRRDVLLFHHGVTIVLEGSFDKADAEVDARRRIEQLAADIAIAVHYPSTFPQNISEHEIRNRLLDAKFEVRVILPDDISGTFWEIWEKKSIIGKPSGGWYEIDLTTLASLTKEVAQLIIDETLLSEIEKSVETLIEKVVYSFSGSKSSDKIAENINEILYRVYGFSIGEPTQIKEALFAQASLAVLLGSVYYESIRHVNALPSLRELCDRHGAKGGIEEATQLILKINYELIFDLVKQLLKALPSHEWTFKALLNLVTEIGTKRALLRRDLGGKIYHKVVGSWALKKGLATYYTQVPSAYLLLHLANPKIGKVADFACGSGTLLVAAYSALNSKHRLVLWKTGSDLPPDEIEADFHRTFIGNCHAFDVLGYALQVTVLNLALHSPETPIDHILPSQVIPLGYRESDGVVSLGSLELGRTKPKLELIAGGVQKMGLRGSQMTTLSVSANSGPFDLIVMNPPFSRTTGRAGKEGGGLFGYMGNTEERQIIKKEYEALSKEIKESLTKSAIKLTKNTGLSALLTDEDFKAYKQIWQAGEGLLFLHLADKKIAQDGKICFVLPKAFISGVSWFLARAMLANHYHIENIVVSFEKDHYNFSESTNMAECMFIARRRSKPSAKEKTKFVMLLRQPTTSIESIHLASALSENRKDYIEAGKTRALVKEVTRDSLVQNCDNWGRFICLPETKLLKQIEQILDGTLTDGQRSFKVPMVKLNQLLETIGVENKRFGDTYEILSEKVPGSLPMIWGGEEDQRMSMLTPTNAFAYPLIPQGIQMFDDKASILLVPDRIWIPTAHVTAIISDKKTIANIFYSLRFKNQTDERYKALCAWLNTTWGILSILSNRQDTRGGFVRTKMTQWRLLPVLDLDEISGEVVGSLARLFDKYKSKAFGRIPTQYNLVNKQHKSRLEYDLEFLQAIGHDTSRSKLERLYSPMCQAFDQWLGEAK